MPKSAKRQIRMRTAVYGAESKLNVDGRFWHVVIFYFNAVNAWKGIIIFLITKLVRSWKVGMHTFSSRHIASSHMDIWPEANIELFDKDHESLVKILYITVQILHFEQGFQHFRCCMVAIVFINTLHVRLCFGKRENYHQKRASLPSPRI